MFTIETESSLDRQPIEDLLDRAFGRQRLAKISYRYRVAIPPIKALSFVAKSARDIIGSIRYWPVLLEDQTVLLLGPLAIEPALQRRGIGRMLTCESLIMAERMGYRTVFLVGDPGYYRHLGFVRSPVGVVMPDEDPMRLQIRNIGSEQSDRLDGILTPWRPVQ